MSNWMTIDKMIDALRSIKKSGLPGDTPVGMLAKYEFGGKSAWGAKLDVEPGIGRISKGEHDKGLSHCRVVSREGVPVVIIS